MRLKVKSCVGSISPLLALIKFLKSAFSKEIILFFSKDIFLYFQEIMQKPFSPPPPSSFEALQACTVSLSAPLSDVIFFLRISHRGHCEGGQTTDW